MLKKKGPIWVSEAPWFIKAASFLSIAAMTAQICVLNFQSYSFIFGYLSKELIVSRYVITISIRLAFVFAAFKALSLNNKYRHILLGFFFFNLIFMPFKHPIEAIRMQNALIDRIFLDDTVFIWIPFFEHLLYEWRIKVLYSLMDIFLSLGGIAFLELKCVKKHFK